MAESEPAQDRIPTPSDGTVGRRLLFRGGAMLAGAGVVGAVLTPTSEAADGDPVRLGADNDCVATTGIAIRGETGRPDVPTLTLTNAQGPALRLAPLERQDWHGTMPVGSLVAFDDALVTCLDRGEGAETTQLLTMFDFDEFPITVPLSPTRVLDTRSSPLREGIIRSSAGAFDAHHRLRAGSWLDLALSPSLLQMYGAWLSVTSSDSVKAGYLQAYAPGERPLSTTTSFQAGTTTTSGCFSEVGEVDTLYAVRLRTTATTHLVVDITGFVAGARPSQLAGPASAVTTRYRSRASRMRRMVERAR